MSRSLPPACDLPPAPLLGADPQLDVSCLWTGPKAGCAKGAEAGGAGSVQRGSEPRVRRGAQLLLPPSEPGHVGQGWGARGLCGWWCFQEEGCGGSSWLTEGLGWGSPRAVGQAWQMWGGVRVGQGLQAQGLTGKMALPCMGRGLQAGAPGRGWAGAPHRGSEQVGQPAKGAGLPGSPWVLLALGSCPARVCRGGLRRW